MSETTPGGNEGIIITGGHVEASAMAAGKGASAHADVVTKAPSDLNEVRRQLAEIARILGERREELDQPDEMIDSVGAAEQELERESPDKSTLLRLLEKVTAGVGHVEGLSTSLGHLTAAVDRLF